MLLSFPKGKIIFRFGDRVPAYYRLTRGVVAIYTRDRLRMLDLQTKGDCVGGIHHYLSQKYPNEAIAYTDVQIEKTSCPVDERQLIRQQNNSLAALAKLIDFQDYSAREKAIAGVHWFLSQASYDLSENKIAKIPLDDKTITQITGLARETITRALSPLVKEGILTRNVTYWEIHDWHSFCRFLPVSDAGDRSIPSCT